MAKLFKTFRIFSSHIQCSVIMRGPISFWFLVITSCHGKTFEDVYKICDGVPGEELEPCVIKLINDLRPLIKTGIPELELRPEELPFDPTEVKGDDGINRVKARFESGKIKGLEDFKITHLKMDYQNRAAVWAIVLPELTMTCGYNMDANIMYFELFGKGNSRIRFDDMHIYGESKLDLLEIDGNYRLQQIDADIAFSYSKADMKLSGMYNGHAGRQKAAVDFLEDNVDVVIDHLRPAIRKIFGQVIGNVVNKSMGKIDLKNLAGSVFIKEAFLFSP